MISITNVNQFPELPRQRPGTSHEYAYQRLRHALMVGAIAPGISITIQELADQLGLSATPIREALRQLASENALVTLRNRRIQVPDMSLERFEELISVRCSLEAYAARRALPYVNQVLIDAAEQIDFELDEAMENNDWESAVVLNQRFHSRIYAANPLQIVTPMIESLWLQLGPFMGVAARYTNEIYLVDHHKDIVKALRAGDETALIEALESDIRDGLSLMKVPSFEGFRNEG